ncbi:MAG TPA: DUF1349 domain-containing protein, partial [Pirellulales bacterium]|nr:DUF1349 domain-containing protein [Pirellulales bacterium]
MNPLRQVLLAMLIAILVTVNARGDDKKPETIEGWGTIIDPLGDCTIKREKQKLVITAPGGTHDLNLLVGGMTAPRVLQPLEGDFDVTVKVTSDFNPGHNSPAFNTRPFNSAGLLVWQDKKNYLRLERNKWWAEEGGAYACYPPLIEGYRNGVFLETNPLPTWDRFFRGKSTWLRLERRGESFTASYSHDGEKWSQAKQIKMELAKQLRVGVVAVNTSANDLTVEF